MHWLGLRFNHGSFAMGFNSDVYKPSILAGILKPDLSLGDQPESEIVFESLQVIPEPRVRERLV